MGRITNLIPSHVSIVDKAANKRSFLLMKDDTQPNVETDVRLIKQDTHEQIVYGVVYEPDVVDAHGDYMSAQDIEKAAHVFLKEFRNIDKQHDFTSKVGEVIESYIAPADFELGGQTVTKGTWMMAVKVVDDVWTGIQKGEFTGFSLAGYGNVEKAQDTPQEPSEDEQTEAGFMQMMKQFFRRLAKGEIKDDIEASRPKNEMSRAIFHFTDIAEGELWRDRPDVERIRIAHQELGEYINQFAVSTVTKSEDEQGEEVMNMTKEEIQALIDEGVQKALAKQEESTDETSPQAGDDVEKSQDATDDTTETTEQTELAKAMQEIEELKKQLDARPVAFSSGAEVTKTEAPVTKSYLKFFG
ncbi:XkdF-like putative serine protease domain-containing protein [Exiguobacterium sp. MMG028]|uniref:XkdF-like putative serine protease domain-containing protein n=1 Tax=Exiguobacterium sp. MMG028 TaxID=3021979 RepID=UPI0022FE5AB4|nr:XkdF-like putative serine protease domain-containing protein [Exiguobacterium sp. MMG028]MDA5561960.1 XkdF-like putative serine protease domain-containing protein [Exiguobacterium sp. MMG028]